jgi:competence protein ComEC
MFIKLAIPDKIWAITAVSIAAQAGTLPVVLFYFHQFPLYSLITNLIVIPLSSLIIYAGILVFILPSHTVIIEAASYLLNLLVTLMDAGVGFVEHIPYGMLEGIYINLAMAVLLALFIGMISVALVARKKQALIMGLVVLLTFSLYRTRHHYHALLQEVFVVYAVRGHSAYDVIQGTDHIFYADSTLHASPGKIDYSIAPNWLTLNLNNPTPQTLNAKPYTLNVKRKKVLAWHGDLPSAPPEKKLQLDYLILRGKIEFDPADVFLYFDPTLVILDSSVPPWIKAPEGVGRFYDVRKSGAFVSN